MHALIVVSHPLTDSLTQQVAEAVAQGITQASRENSSEIASLTQEGFNPVFNAGDHTAFTNGAPLPADVLKEQARIEKADALVLVFPIYWWAMPGLLKGWIDRVFSNGWAYEEGANGKVSGKLGHLPVHLVALGGSDMKTFDKHGYAQSWKTQIAHGIFDYCGAPVRTNATLMLPDFGTPQALLQEVLKLSEQIFPRPQ